ncbi:MAG: hypothetical protein ACKOAD_00090 [Gammaproteobacteria bacterium]
MSANQPFTQLDPIAEKLQSSVRELEEVKKILDEKTQTVDQDKDILELAELNALKDLVRSKVAASEEIIQKFKNFTISNGKLKLSKSFGDNFLKTQEQTVSEIKASLSPRNSPVNVREESDYEELERLETMSESIKDEVQKTESQLKEEINVLKGQIEDCENRLMGLRYEKTKYAEFRTQRLGQAKANLEHQLFISNKELTQLISTKSSETSSPKASSAAAPASSGIKRSGSVHELVRPNAVEPNAVEEMRREYEQKIKELELERQKLRSREQGIRERENKLFEKDDLLARTTLSASTLNDLRQELDRRAIDLERERQEFEETRLRSSNPSSPTRTMVSLADDMKSAVEYLEPPVSSSGVSFGSAMAAFNSGLGNTSTALTLSRNTERQLQEIQQIGGFQNNIRDRQAMLEHLRVERKDLEEKLTQFNAKNTPTMSSFSNAGSRAAEREIIKEKKQPILDRIGKIDDRMREIESQIKKWTQDLVVAVLNFRPEQAEQMIPSIRTVNDLFSQGASTGFNPEILRDMDGIVGLYLRNEEIRLKMESTPQDVFPETAYHAMNEEIKHNLLEMERKKSNIQRLVVEHDNEIREQTRREMEQKIQEKTIELELIRKAAETKESSLEDQIRELRKNAGSNASLLSDLRTQLAEAQDQHDSEMRTLERALSDLRSDFSKLTKENNRLSRELSLSQDREQALIRKSDEEQAKHKREMHATTERLETALRTEELRHSTEIQRMREGAREELERTKKDHSLEMGGMQQTIEEMQADKVDLQRSNSSLKLLLDQEKEKNTRNDRVTDRLQAELENMRKEMADLRSSNATLTSELEQERLRHVQDNTAAVERERRIEEQLRTELNAEKTERSKVGSLLADSKRRFESQVIDLQGQSRTKDQKIADIELKLSRKESEIRDQTEAHQKELRSAIDALERFRKTAIEAKNALDSALAERKIAEEENRLKIKTLEDSLSSVERALKREKDQHGRDAGDSKIEIDRIRNELDGIKGENIASEAKRKALLEALKKETERHRTAEASAQANMRHLQEMADKLKATLDAEKFSHRTDQARDTRRIAELQTSLNQAQDALRRETADHRTALAAREARIAALAGERDNMMRARDLMQTERDAAARARDAMQAQRDQANRDLLDERRLHAVDVAERDRLAKELAEERRLHGVDAAEVERLKALIQKGKRGGDR